MAGWNIVLIFPNLSLNCADLFSADGIRICSADELESVEASDANQTCRELVSRFQSVFGERYKPSILAVDASRSQLLIADVLRDFRNACAISTICGGRAATLGDGGQWNIRYSDFFLFNHHTAGKDGSIVTLEGISRGMGDEIHDYTGSALAMIRNPANFTADIDKPLLQLLLTCWHRRHFKKRSTRENRQVFRALEIAFQASRFPSDGFVTQNDVGTRIGLWVSAFEALFHPGNRNVDKRQAQKALRTAQWTSKEFTHLRYTAFHRGQKFRASLPEKLYDQLYAARNDFMHGNRTKLRSKVWRFKGKQVPLEFVTPCLFAAALRAKLNHRPREIGPLSDEHSWGIGRVQRAIALKSVRATRQP
jgi:hypothetical protein